MDTNEHLVYGEPADALNVGIERVVRSVRRRPDGHYEWSGDLTDPDGLPLLRAIYRAEAEVLIEEADALARPDRVPRTEYERKRVAFARISEGLDTQEASR